MSTRAVPGLLMLGLLSLWRPLPARAEALTLAFYAPTAPFQSAEARFSYVEKLAQKVTKGGTGVWGAIPMPANPQVSDAEAKQLVQWIMTLK